MTTELPDNQPCLPANPPLALSSSAVLGPAVPQDVMTYLTAYGDSRADEDGLCGLRIAEAIRALRRWSAAVQAAERERWQRIATNAQAVTTGCQDRLDYFEVPSHLMAALALALDEGPNLSLSGKTADNT